MLNFVRSHRRRLPLEHVLIAGHIADLDDIAVALALLPADAYGQVLIEAPAGSLDGLTAPARVSIQRIEPSTGSLDQAVTAWVSEWVPQELDLRRNVTVWLGGHASSRVDLRDLGVDHLTI
ncbi:hypothetical protein ATK17_1208 [Branchiibius hedensis]|uniref:Siderophore-interacting protein n=1 Tax=Branchiibius hedensis TaxID=672460 RepID=A0A2Y8ZNB0_9MICO|nr:hypothetical protein ATK17_1208 [Branchiibius hedensis]SSA33911.1 hypothetical protein SAMN04489750_1208 [Branchiibius hedensis]